MELWRLHEPSSDSDSCLVTVALQRLLWRLKNWEGCCIVATLSSSMWELPLVVKLMSFKGMFIDEFGRAGTGCLHNDAHLHPASASFIGKAFKLEKGSNGVSCARAAFKPLLAAGPLCLPRDSG